MNSKKIIFIILGIVVTLGLCFAILCSIYPEMLGKEEETLPTVEGKKFTDEDLFAEGTPEETHKPTPETTEMPASQSLAETTPEPTVAPVETPKPTETPAPTATPKPTEAPTPKPTETPAPTASPNGSETNVVDRYAPVFLTIREAKVKIGSTFDVHKFVGYADDADRDVAMEVTGKVDTSKEGTYPITITLTDDAGHKTSKTIDVKVVESTSSGGSGGGGGKKEEFADFVKKYKTDFTSVGIDVSRWQEDIDFEKVKAAGCEFVIIRLGGYDNGEHYTDRYYKANIANAKAAGLKVGIYWHAEESSRKEVKASVDYLLSVLGDNTLDFPIAYDWEDYINFEQYGMNLRDLTECFYAFAEELNARGYVVCLYGSKNSHKNIWQNDKNYPEWLAHYTSSTDYDGDYYMWQHSSTGKIDGIKGDVDLDVLYNEKWKKVMGQ